MVRCILCQHIVRTTRLTQIRQSLGIHRLTLERVTHNIVLQAAHLATRRLVGIHILHRASIVIKLEPRLGHHTANLHGLLLGGILHQRITAIHHRAIVATLEINLHQVVRHQIAVDSARSQSRETIASHVKLTTRIGHIGLVVSCVVGIIARRYYAREITLGINIIALHKCHITHTQIVLVLLRRRKRTVIGLGKLCGSLLVITHHTVVGTQRKLHIIGISRTAILRQVTLHTSLGVTHLELRITQCEIVLYLLDMETVVHTRKLRPQILKLGASLNPMA